MKPIKYPQLVGLSVAEYKKAWANLNRARMRASAAEHRDRTRNDPIALEHYRKRKREYHKKRYWEDGQFREIVKLRARNYYNKSDFKRIRQKIRNGTRVCCFNTTDLYEVKTPTRSRSHDWYEIIASDPDPLQSLIHKEEKEETKKWEHINRRVEWHFPKHDATETKIDKLLSTAPTRRIGTIRRTPISSVSPERGLIQRHIKMRPTHFV